MTQTSSNIYSIWPPLSAKFSTRLMLLRKPANCHHLSPGEHPEDIWFFEKVFFLMLSRAELHHVGLIHILHPPAHVVGNFLPWNRQHFWGVKVILKPSSPPPILTSPGSDTTLSRALKMKRFASELRKRCRKGRKMDIIQDGASWYSMLVYGKNMKVYE